MIQLKVDETILLKRIETRVAQMTARGEKLRADDNPDVLRGRLAAYRAQTAPLADYYAARGMLKAVDGMAPIDAVMAAIDRILSPAQAAKGKPAAAKPSRRRPKPVKRRSKRARAKTAARKARPAGSKGANQAARSAGARGPKTSLDSVNPVPGGG